MTTGYHRKPQISPVPTQQCIRTRHGDPFPLSFAEGSSTSRAPGLWLWFNGSLLERITCAYMWPDLQKSA